MKRVILRRDVCARKSKKSSVTIVKYVHRECCRNLAYKIGGTVVDGCKEFVASGAEGTGGDMTCATCGCHRYFHRLEEQTHVVRGCSSYPTTRTGGL